MIKQIVIKAESRDVLHGILRNFGQKNQKQLPSLYTNGLAIININEENIPVIRNYTTVFQTLDIPVFNVGQHLVVTGEVHLNKKNETGGQVTIDKKDVFKKFAALDCLELDYSGSSCNTINPSQPLVTSKFTSHNAFILNAHVVVKDKQKFNDLLTYGFGNRGNYGYGLIRAKL